MAATIDYVADWGARLRTRLFWQFKQSPNLLMWVDLVARQCNDIESFFQSLLTLASIDDSYGAQLDGLGRLLGIPRSGVDDATYRSYLKAWILALRSGGSSESIYKVFRALLGPSVSMVIFTGQIGFKTFVLRINDTMTAASAARALVFLRKAKEAGARAILEFSEVGDPLICRFDVSTPGFDVGVFGGATQA